MFVKPPALQNPPAPAFSMSRRSFLAGLVGAAAVTAVALHETPSYAEDTDPPLEDSESKPKDFFCENSAADNPIKTETLGKKEKIGFFQNFSEGPIQDPMSYFSTFCETGITFLLQGALANFIEKLGIKNGNSAHSEEMLVKNFAKYPILTWLTLGFVTPVVEEYCARYIPASIGTNGDVRGPVNWNRALIWSGLFAGAHIFRFDFTKAYNNGKLRWSDFGINKTLPVAPFIWGMYLWQLMQRRGMDHAIASHLMVNNLGLLHIYDQLKPKIEEYKKSQEQK